MNKALRKRLRELAGLSDTVKTAGEAFIQQHETAIEAYRQQISLGIDDALEHMQQEVSAISADNAFCRQLTAQVAEYISWMKWALWDLPYFAVALAPSHEKFRSAVTACGLVYLSIRIFDDVVDQHFWYKGRHQTVLARAGEGAQNGHEATSLAVLAGLLVCFEGLDRLAGPTGPAGGTLLPQVIRSVRRTVIGAMMECSEAETWTQEYYTQMVQLKNVDYWRVLYTAIDPAQASPLYPFLVEYYELAQNLNDVQDFDEDQQQGQPNLLSLYLPDAREPDCTPFGDRRRVAPLEVELLLADKLLALGSQAQALPQPERGVAQFKLAESLEAACRLGLFAEPQGLDAFPAPPPRLYWYSDLQSVVAQVGAQALEQTSCDVCGAAERTTLFRKQGFSYHRCLSCRHIYISPRILPVVQELLREDLDNLSIDDSYLEVQRFHADRICQLLRDKAPGPRLLDVGFGRGYLMRLAQAHGFEVYGLDSSEAQVGLMAPLFGRRVAHVVVGEDEIPWRELDVVVMSHVLEHLPQPATALKEIYERLNPAGILFVVVPDMDSMHFKIFGKRWDVLNPLVHFQYFNESSLTRLLERCGFEDAERVHHPMPHESYLPRWARLMRQLGGSEVSEFSMLVKKTGGS